MNCTIWETGYQVYAIPYLMKKEYGQEPRHINQKYRNTWAALTYSGSKYGLQAGEWVEVEDAFENIIKKEKDAELEYLKKDINRKVLESINGACWMDKRLNSLRESVEKRFNLNETK